MQSFYEKILEMKKWIDNAQHIVFFTGAGVSVASGIPDFRSENGLYSKKYKNISPEKILSHSFWKNDPITFYNYYLNNLTSKTTKPNQFHKYVAYLSQNKDCWTITQNIDNLDTMAGNKKIAELHGNSNRNYCINCHANHDLDSILKHKDKNGIPRCKKDQGIIKPDVVLYEESLNFEVINLAIEKLIKADLLVIAGTSLSVYPAASFINYYEGRKIILINKENQINFKSKYQSIIFSEDIENVFQELNKK